MQTTPQSLWVQRRILRLKTAQKKSQREKTQTKPVKAQAESTTVNSTQARPAKTRPAKAKSAENKPASEKVSTSDQALCTLCLYSISPEMYIPLCIWLSCTTTLNVFNILA